MMASRTRTARRLLAVTLALFITLVWGSLAQAAVSTFSNNTGITITDNADGGDPQPGDPYPSTIAVAGVLGTVTKVTVTITGLTHTGPQDVDVLLVGPTGIAMILMSDTGGGGAAAAANLTFDDAAALDLPQFGDLVTGTYKPTNYDDGDPAGTDVFPATAPAGPYGAVLAGFNGLNPNGTWQLFVVDDAAGGAGVITGWSVTITHTPPAELPFKIIATGTGPGGGPHVKLFKIDTAGTVTTLGDGFFAYDPGFLGGVSVALADFDNDGTPEIITAPRGNGGPHVRVFKVDPVTGAVTAVGGGFFAYEAGFLGGVSFAVTDLDGDTVPEILTAPNSNGGSHVKVFKFDVATGIATLTSTEFFAYDPGFTGGINIGAQR